MIRSMLDTDMCVFVIRKKSIKVIDRIARQTPGSIAISIITLAELRFGAAKSADPTAELQNVAKFIAPFVILPFDELAAAAYGPMRTHLQSTGQSIGPLDTLIAAHALSRDLVLVTGNEAEFRRVPKLKVENWAK